MAEDALQSVVVKDLERPCLIHITRWISQPLFKLRISAGERWLSDSFRQNGGRSCLANTEFYFPCFLAGVGEKKSLFIWRCHQFLEQPREGWWSIYPPVCSPLGVGLLARIGVFWIAWQEQKGITALFREKKTFFLHFNMQQATAWSVLSAHPVCNSQDDVVNAKRLKTAQDLLVTWSKSNWYCLHCTQCRLSPKLTTSTRLPQFRDWIDHTDCNVSPRPI